MPHLAYKLYKKQCCKNRKCIGTKSVLSLAVLPQQNDNNLQIINFPQQHLVLLLTSVLSGSNVITWEVAAHDLKQLKGVCNYKIKGSMSFIFLSHFGSLMLNVEYTSVVFSFFSHSCHHNQDTLSKKSCCIKNLDHELYLAVATNSSFLSEEKS